MKRIEFKPPPGVNIPEGKGSGDTFDQLSTYRIKPNGMLCLVAMGDVQMPGYDDKKMPMQDRMKEMGESATTRYKEKMGATPTGGGDMDAGGGGY